MDLQIELARVKLTGERFIQLDSIIVIDFENMLMWEKQGSVSKFSWYTLMHGGTKPSFGGYKGWRLPTIEELHSLVRTEYIPAIDPIFDCKSAWYWSSDAHSEILLLAKGVHFFGGGLDLNNKSDEGYVRYCRNFHINDLY